MKRLLSLAILLLALPSFSDGVLWPAEHTTCLNANNPTMWATCPAGTELYIDNDSGSGRCACLSSEEYTPADVCAAENYTASCNEAAGQSFTKLYRAAEMCGRSQAGCGCFSTDEGVHITSIDGVQ